jgi:hypothetical protein
MYVLGYSRDAWTRTSLDFFFKQETHTHVSFLLARDDMDYIIHIRCRDIGICRLANSDTF